MTPEKELQLAFRMALILGIIGFLCYAAIPVKTEKPPVRKMFTCIAGKVLFTHEMHTAQSGYGVSCKDCHHHNEKDEAEFRACGDCHFKEDIKQVPELCLSCHEPGEDHHGNEDVAELTCNDCHKVTDDESLPQACTDCHEPDEIEGQEKSMDMQKRMDAFHNQCIDCHKEYDAGPVECSECHVM